MRSSVQVLIYINLALALEDQIPFYRSANNVILSAGIDGKLPVKYFSKVCHYSIKSGPGSKYIQS